MDIYGKKKKKQQMLCPYHIQILFTYLIYQKRKVNIMIATKQISELTFQDFHALLHDVTKIISHRNLLGTPTTIFGYPQRENYGIWDGMFAKEKLIPGKDKSNDHKPTNDLRLTARREHTT